MQKREHERDRETDEEIEWEFVTIRHTCEIAMESRALDRERER